MPSSKKYISIFPEFIQNIYLLFKNKTQLSKWNKQSHVGIVPHVVKQNKILQFKNLYNINILVETGTYLGDMVWAQRNNFNQIYSIELDKKLSTSAQKRFRKNKNITIIQGDSSRVLPKLAPQITEKAIFWLDAHYSGGITARGEKDCPILDELKTILSTNPELEHIVLIDDVRLFIGERDFPTLDRVSTFIRNVYPNSIINIENDCIIVELKQ